MVEIGTQLNHKSIVCVCVCAGVFIRGAGGRHTHTHTHTQCDQCRLFAGCQWSHSPREDRDKGKRQGEGGAERPISGNIHTLVPHSRTTQHTTQTPSQCTDTHYLSPTHTFWLSLAHTRTHTHTHAHTHRRRRI